MQKQLTAKTVRLQLVLQHF